jgi:hypothetical protein
LAFIFIPAGFYFRHLFHFGNFDQDEYFIERRNYAFRYSFNRIFYRIINCPVYYSLLPDGVFDKEKIESLCASLAHH